VDHLLPISLAAPIVLLLAAAIGVKCPGRRPGRYPALAEAAAFTAFLLSAAGIVQFLVAGSGRFETGAGLFLMVASLDAVTATMTTLVAFVGWIVARYARTYLDGEEREGAFHGLLLATLAAVLLLVQAGSMAMLFMSFLAVGAAMHKLLLFYPARAEARRAAAKFTLFWTAGDAAILLAGLLLWSAFSTTDLAALNAAASSHFPLAAQFAVALLVVAAALKTASFPLHGWLTEVMEAPTPVSALLHAGIINAGGLLLIRLAEVVQASTGAMAALVMLGGFTALFGGMVMLTQSAIKTALAWSTVAQMGFMLMQCGLGLWALALLHIVAHSLYKAHAFLNSGSAVEAVARIRKPGPIAVPDLRAVAGAFLIAVLLYAMVATGFAWFVGPKSPQAVALGAILVFGVAYLVAQGLADAAPRALTRRTAAASAMAAIAYFTFHIVSETTWGPSLPAAPAPGPLEWALIIVGLSSFGMVAVAQALFPHWAHHPAAAGLRVHMANGFYLNALTDRLIGGYRAGHHR
jgi:NAD(P)H-quinone oxidoreductase subunit 5